MPQINGKQLIDGTIDPVKLATVTYTPTGPNDVTTVAYVEALVSTLDFQADIEEVQIDNTLDPSASPADGERYVLTDVGNLNANFGTINTDINGDPATLEDNDIVEFSSAQGAFFVAYDVSVRGPGAMTWSRADSFFIRWDGILWAEFGGLSGITAGAGLSKTGNVLNIGSGTGITVNADTIEIDGAALAGDAIGFTGSTFNVEASDSTITVAAGGISVNTTGLATTLAGNGLAANGSALDLGGTLTANVLFDGDNGTREFAFGSFSGGTDHLSIFDVFALNRIRFLTFNSTPNTQGSLTVDEDDVSISVQDNGTGNATQIRADLNQILLDRQTTGDNQSLVFNATAMTITDELNSAGLVYAADYSTANAANDRWIVDKAYVDSAVLGVTLLNGLGTTANGAAVDLGGAFNDSSISLVNTATTVEANGSFSIDIDGSAATTGISELIAGTPAFYRKVVYSKNTLAGERNFRQYAASGEGQSVILFEALTDTTVVPPNNVAGLLLANSGYGIRLDNTDGIDIQRKNGANIRGISINDSTFQVEDSVSSLGLQYAADYSANNAANARWIVDKGYVDSQVSGASQGIDDVLGIGQTLTADRSITTGAGNTLTFDYSGGSIAFVISTPGDGPINRDFQIENTAQTDVINRFAQNEFITTILGNNSAVNTSATFTVQGTGAPQISFNVDEDSVAEIAVTVNQNAFTVTATGTAIGMQYAADYSGLNTTNDRWIVDKGYVDGAVAAASLQNGSGTTFVAGSPGQVNLGGTLTSNAFIGLSTSTFRLSADDGTRSSSHSWAATGVTMLVEDSNDSDIYTSYTQDLDDITLEVTDQGANADRSTLTLTPLAATFRYGDPSGSPAQIILNATNVNISKGEGSLLLNDDVRMRAVASSTDSEVYSQTTSLLLQYRQNTDTTPTAKSILFNNSGMTVTDATDLAGLSYAADYSAANAANDRWIVDKGYVDSQIASGGVSAGSGITDNAGTFNLGGALTLDTTTISRDSTNNTEVIIDIEDTVDGDQTRMSMGNVASGPEFRLDVLTGGSFGSGFFAAAAQTSLYYENATGDRSTIGVNASSMTITDDINAAGLVYASDYSAANAANDRWLTDKGYVDAEIAAGSFTLTNGNGTTANGTAVDLGGTLSAATTLLGGSQNLSLGTAGSTLSAFELQSNPSGGATNLFSMATVDGLGQTVFSMTLGAGADLAQIQFTQGAATYSATNGLNIENNDATDGNVQILMNSGAGQFEIVDARTTPTGIEYDADYSANYTSRSLVDQAYVLAQVAAGAVTVDQGLTDNGGTIELGGDITFGADGSGLDKTHIIDTSTAKVTVNNGATQGDISDLGYGLYSISVSDGKGGFNNTGGFAAGINIDSINDTQKAGQFFQGFIVNTDNVRMVKEDSGEPTAVINIGNNYDILISTNLVAGRTIDIRAEADGVLLNSSPTGSVALAVSTVDYVDTQLQGITYTSNIQYTASGSADFILTGLASGNSFRVENGDTSTFFELIGGAGVDHRLIVDADNGISFTNTVNGVTLSASPDGNTALAVATVAYVDSQIAAATLGAPTSTNLAQTPTVTSGNASSTGISFSGTPTGFLIVAVNGLIVNLGDGVLTGDAYFSADGGTTARAYSAIASGDTLYWNGVVAGYDLAATDRVSIFSIVA